MRLWLDEMISAEVARQLRGQGFDVQSVVEPGNEWARGLDDAEQLAAAARQERTLVSYNIRDFISVSQHWAEADRGHFGVILIHSRSIEPSDIGALVKSLARLLDTHREHTGLPADVLFLERPRNGVS